MLNPITNNKNYLINYAIVWSMIIGAHFAVLYGYYKLPIWIALSDSLVFNVFFAFLGISLWYVIRYNKSNSKFLVLFTNYVVSAMLIVGLWLVTGYMLLQYFVDESSYQLFLEASFPWRIVNGVFYFAVFVLVYYVVIYYQDIQEKLRKEANLKTLLKEVELSSLKNQINPHFLFNSLNSISSLTMTSPERAQEMVIKLSEYLRYSLSTESVQVTTLEKELSNIKLYLAIEKIRFGNRLHFEVNCPKICLPAKIPPMILQPLMENAIKHGVYESTAPIHIKLTCILNEEELQLTLKNNFDPEAKQVKGAGIGLKNTRERLFLIYKRNDLFAVKKAKNTFTVTLKFPQNEKI
ncbi:sensor histidine kinase [Leptobacterium sp. I13]|uniref:sensor histidine kinase n=1 Tax=Leptobacterium meishanense TaxID=3128904 RepID=UPI0030EC65FB